MKIPSCYEKMNTDVKYSFFNEDVHREYDCYELKCTECSSCNEESEAYIIRCPKCDSPMSSKTVYECGCGCIIDPCIMDPCISFIAGIAVPKAIKEIINGREDII